MTTQTVERVAADVDDDQQTPAMCVALVNMPFASTRYGSIQLGLLQAILRRRGIPTTVHYLNLRFAQQIGWEPYEIICNHRWHSLGEWIFARAAFAEGTRESQAFLEEFPDAVQQACESLDCTTDFLVDLREREAPAFIDECLDAVPWDQYDVVGFGSLFEQNCAALALARRIKERFPHLTIVFGGSNFEDEMGLEYVRTMPWIDYAVIGEGDEVFPALLDRLAKGEDVLAMPGVARRGPDGMVFGGRAPIVTDLDALPEPDYDDYFTTAAALQMPGLVFGGGVQMLFESGRGCWWGAKHHCTFCGLNGLGMAFRSKSPERLLEGLDELARRHHIYTFEAVDNIMDHRYIREVFDGLIGQRKDYTFFYEVKANLTQEHLRTLARAGVRRLQPGIESLSTGVLKLMRKGTTSIQNVRLLKWAKYYDISISWNVLSGFPGEQPQDYAQQMQVMRLIPHLEPPTGCTRIWLERYSPNFTEAEERGIINVRPDRSYACIYPGGIDLERIAYFFEYDAPSTLTAEAHEPLRDHIRAWRERWESTRRPYLGYLRGAGRLTVLDGRRSGEPRVHVFEESAALAYEFCGPTSHRMPQVLAHVLDDCGIETNPAAVQRHLDEFTERGLMLEEDGQYLSLALPANANW